MNYYEESRVRYQERYRKIGDLGNGISDALRYSGFLSYPWKEYSTILRTINYFPEHFNSIYDMGCGSGLLLNYIETHLGYAVDLFGVDFVEDSIFFANRLYPNYHFICTNVINYRLSIKPDSTCLALVNPYHYRNYDLQLLIQYYLQLNIKIILYTYSDVLFGLCYKSILDFEIFNTYKSLYSIINTSINTAIIDR